MVIKSEIMKCHWYITVRSDIFHTRSMRSYLHKLFILNFTYRVYVRAEKMCLMKY